jgi:hypothetical protein
MQALEMWTARPHSTAVIVLLARDFGTKGLRALLRQFDQVAPGKRCFQRLMADGIDCIWDTMMMVKQGPKPWPKFGSVELNAEHARLVQLRKTDVGRRCLRCGNEGIPAHMKGCAGLKAASATPTKHAADQEPGATEMSPTGRKGLTH